MDYNDQLIICENCLRPIIVLNIVTIPTPKYCKTCLKYAMLWPVENKITWFLLRLLNHISSTRVSKKVVDALTINEENRLRRQVEELKIERSEIHKFKAELDELK